MWDGKSELRFSFKLLYQTLYLLLVDSYRHSQLRWNVLPPIKFQRRRTRIRRLSHPPLILLRHQNRYVRHVTLSLLLSVISGYCLSLSFVFGYLWFQTNRWYLYCLDVRLWIRFGLYFSYFKYFFINIKFG